MERGDITVLLDRWTLRLTGVGQVWMRNRVDFCRGAARVMRRGREPLPRAAKNAAACGNGAAQAWLRRR